MKFVEIFVVGNAHEDDLSLLEKLAQFSMSYSCSGHLSDFDPLTGALSNRTASRADGQTKMCATAARGKLSLYRKQAKLWVCV